MNPRNTFTLYHLPSCITLLRWLPASICIGVSSSCLSGRYKMKTVQSLMAHIKYEFCFTWSYSVSGPWLRSLKWNSFHPKCHLFILIFFAGNFVGLTDPQHSRAQHLCDYSLLQKQVLDQVKWGVYNVVMRMVPIETLQGDIWSISVQSNVLRCWTKTFHFRKSLKRKAHFTFSDNYASFSCSICYPQSFQHSFLHAWQSIWKTKT